ncbi:MAG: DUF2188 domain-containing protein [Desulfobulbaceae bacterium]
MFIEHPGSHHLIWEANGGWDVKKDGATRRSGHFDKTTIFVSGMVTEA